MSMRKSVAVVAAGGVLMVGLASAANGGVTEPFRIDPFAGTEQAGGSLTVSGQGCPPTGEFPTDTPLALQLVPPTGVNNSGPVIADDGAIQYITTTAYFAGESGAVVTPQADGSFTAEISIPDDAPSGVYAVRGWCTGLLEPADTPRGLSEASMMAAQSEQGSITVEATTTGAAPPQAPPPVVSEPTYTG